MNRIERIKRLLVLFRQESTAVEGTETENGNSISLLQMFRRKRRTDENVCTCVQQRSEEVEVFCWICNDTGIVFND